ncbi:energy transducer TonB [Roseibacillus persicicus]|uniref:energy transducer TonB n=1 Tax=Roseibacillus persicicus TaxID=454148 RepID=UPI00280DD27B|nr:TonB family protein [Roseibacillus persicicus]MDQ8191437.1 TonB family protein [Roseibacillus persicicus]
MRPRLLQLPKETTPLPPPRPREVAAQGLSSVLLATSTVALLGFGFWLFPIVSNLTDNLTEVQAVNTPFTKPNEALSEDAPNPIAKPHRNPTPPKLLQRVQLASPLPTPPISTDSSQLKTQILTDQASLDLKLLAEYQEEEEARLAEILQKEREAEEQRKKEEAEAAQRKAELAEARRVEEARKAKQRAALAAQRAKEQQAKAERDRIAAAERRQKALASKVSSAPTVISKKAPLYPSSAKRAGLEGTTQITATISPSGKVSAASISRSSGHSALDSSALAAVKRWKFAPARNSLGEPITHQVTVPITFRLD